MSRVVLTLRAQNPVPLREGAGGGFVRRTADPRPALPLRGGGIGVVALAMCACAAAAFAQGDQIAHSKHDLSALGPGPVRAVDENEICIFCHVPHNASPVAPLWNRYTPTTYYRIYRSSTLKARVDQPGPASKLCLSCHDGTIALGLTLNRPSTDPILMTQTYMPTGPTNLTNDLSDDHPIGFRYDRVLSNRDRQIRQPELVDHRIKLGERGELECTACHDPHNNELGDFLRITQREGALCTTCHDMDGWEHSVHARSARSVPLTVTNGEQLQYRSMADNACRSCHLSHSAPHRERLLYDRPSMLCITCHDGIGGPSVLGVLNQRSGHRVSRLLEEPRALRNRTQVGHHVECTDCHNPHAVAPDLLAGPLQTTQLGPLVPPPLADVPGVSLSGVSIDRARFYYEVCFRCHGDRAVILRNRIIRQQDEGGDVRREFLPTDARVVVVVRSSPSITDTSPSISPPRSTSRRAKRTWPETLPLARTSSSSRATKVPSKWPLISATSTEASPLYVPVSVISISRQSFRVASTRPSTISLSQELIAPLSTMSRPTISRLASVVPWLWPLPFPLPFPLCDVRGCSGARRGSGFATVAAA